MKQDALVIDVNIPSDQDFKNAYKQYGGILLDKYRPIYDFLMSPTSFNKASIATNDLHLPAVAGIAKDVHDFALDNGIVWEDLIKQFIGAVICNLMEANGYRKTGRKKAIPHQSFTRGEVYELVYSKN